jgi:hypothetical protein
MTAVMGDDDKGQRWVLRPEMGWYKASESGEKFREEA